jgi:hypothetical protein
MSNGLIAFYPLCTGSFSGLLNLTSGSHGWLKQKDIFFLGQRIIIVPPAAPIKLVPLSISHPIISRSCLLIFSCYFHSCCATTSLNSMATKSAVDLPPTNPSIDDNVGGDSGVESTAMTTSSSPTRGTFLMMNGEIPELTDFFKKTSVSEEELQAYHHHGWLTDNVLSSIPEVGIPTVHSSSILCFESHLLAGSGLPPSKFLAAIVNYLGYLLVHFNANAIAALSSFMMLCECWLGIPLDSSLFWYYYSPS